MNAQHFGQRKPEAIKEEKERDKNAKMSWTFSVLFCFVSFADVHICACVCVCVCVLDLTEDNHFEVFTVCKVPFEKG